MLREYAGEKQWQWLKVNVLVPCPTWVTIKERYFLSVSVTAATTESSTVIICLEK